MPSQDVAGKAHIEVTIAAGATESSAFPTYGLRTLAADLPSAFTGTALSLKAAYIESGTYKAVGDSGGAVSVPCGPSQVVILGEVLVAPFAKLVSNAAEAAARTVRVVMMS